MLAAHDDGTCTAGVDPDNDPTDVRLRNDPASLPAILTIAQDNNVTVAT